MIVFAVALCALRIVVLAISGLGLAADEAHYWDWSRHLDWSYPTKGPGIAWAIAGVTRVLGDAPWAIRTVAPISASIGIVFAYGLTRRAAHGLEPRGRNVAAMWGAILVSLFPAYVVTGHLATIDAPYIACWIGASWAALAMFQRLESKGSAMMPALALGALLGVGFLFKYTILLLLPALAITLFVRRKRVSCRWRAMGAIVVIVGVLAICAMPVAVWNQREGWPTVAHLLGHLGAPGGDVPTDDDQAFGRAWTIMWFLEFVGAQVGIVGPALLLMWMGVRTKIDGPARTWCVWAAMPILVVYLGVSLVTDAEANWPIAGYATLLCLAAAHIPGALDARRERVAAWLKEETPRKRAGIIGRKPESWWQLATHWAVGYGGVFALFLTLALVIPLGGILPTDRLERSARLGDLVQDVIDDKNLDTRTLTVMTDRYTSASRLAHELHMRLGEDAPVVTSAASLVGDRKSAYDYWPETDPRRVTTGTVLFVGGARAQKWTRRFDVGTMIPMLDAPDPTFGGLYLTRAYRGVFGGDDE